jgi:hypothetical protein
MFHNPHLNRLIKPVLLVVILAVGAVTLIRAVKTNNPQTDFTVYTLAAQAVLDGGDIYQVQNVRGWNYVYPPLFAITMIPLAKIPLWMGVLAWYLVSVAAIYFSIRMCVEMAGGNGLAISLIPLLLLAGPSLVGLARGQASLLLLCLTTAGLYFEWNGRRPMPPRSSRLAKAPGSLPVW